MKSNNKAQIFSTDIILALFVFVLILISSAWAWDTVREKIYLMENRNDLEQLARNAASVLVQSPGNPVNWTNMSTSRFNQSTVYALGLVKNRQWQLDEKKINRLKELNSTKYSAIKSILGIKGPGYNIHINISRFNTTTNTFDNKTYIGESPNSSAENIVRIDRAAYRASDKSWLLVVVRVWRECYGTTC